MPDIAPTKREPLRGARDAREFATGAKATNPRTSTREPALKRGRISAVHVHVGGLTISGAVRTMTAVVPSTPRLALAQRVTRMTEALKKTWAKENTPRTTAATVCATHSGPLHQPAITASSAAVRDTHHSTRAKAISRRTTMRSAGRTLPTRPKVFCIGVETLARDATTKPMTRAATDATTNACKKLRPMLTTHTPAVRPRKGTSANPQVETSGQSPWKGGSSESESMLTGSSTRPPCMSGHTSERGGAPAAASMGSEALTVSGALAGSGSGSGAGSGSLTGSGSTGISPRSCAWTASSSSTVASASRGVVSGTSAASTGSNTSSDGSAPSKISLSWAIISAARSGRVSRITTAHEAKAASSSLCKASCVSSSAILSPLPEEPSDSKAAMMSC